MRSLLAPAALLLMTTAPGTTTAAPPMLVPAPDSDLQITPLASTGDSIGGYRLPGIPDGLAAFTLDDTTVRLLANHEFGPERGTLYQLANGTRLRGARISFLDIDRRTRELRRAGVAYREVIDRDGALVRTPTQISERPARPEAGFDSFCSGAGYPTGTAGFVDDIFFTHEETSAGTGEHPHGGTVWALDVRRATLYALPELGRGSWENVAAVTTPDGDRPDGHVALLLADDFELGGAPLYLWIGHKRPGGTFPERNGLARGELFTWVPEQPDRSPEQWRGSGTRRDGRFIRLPGRRPENAGRPGHDHAGYPDDTLLRSRAVSLGAFIFSRPEDLHPNPANGHEIAFASTGHGGLYPADDWGNLHLIRMRFTPDGKTGLQARAEIELLYDSDERGDLGIRSPDNLVWATDGSVYVQEDKAVKRASFGAPSGREAGIWQLDPSAPAASRFVAMIDRKALPPGTTDSRAAVAGEWESSGIIDVSDLFRARPRELVLLATVQAHSVTDGPIGGPGELVQAGQILWLTRPVR